MIRHPVFFCQTEVESVEHLLFSCKLSSGFWKHVLSWLRYYNISVDNLKEEAVIVEEKSLRHVAMVAKCLDDNKPKKSLKTFSNFTDLI